MKYSHICIGGTFDHLHAGHRAIINFTLEHGEEISIGIVSDEFNVEKKFAQSLQPFSLRKKNIQAYLKKKKATATLFELKDVYGIAADDETLDAIVVTEETKENALKINKMRKMKDLTLLKILIFDMIKGNDEKVIRATRIRKGVINKNGDSYLKLLTRKNNLKLPNGLRNQLQHPFGYVIEGCDDDIYSAAKKLTSEIKKRKPLILIAVGDIVTKTLIDSEIKPDISIVDYKTQRKKTITHPHLNKKIHLLNNPAGTIQKTVVLELYSLIQKCINNKKPEFYTLHIKGEEDLLALPAIMLAPLGSVVLYGQQGLGVVLVEITEEMKDTVTAIVKKFE